MVLVLKVPVKLYAMPFPLRIGFGEFQANITFLDAGLVHCIIVPNNFYGHVLVVCGIFGLGGKG